LAEIELLDKGVPELHHGTHVPLLRAARNAALDVDQPCPVILDRRVELLLVLSRGRQPFEEFVGFLGLALEDNEAEDHANRSVHVLTVGAP
jgi:hypothetical protein